MAGAPSKNWLKGSMNLFAPSRRSNDSKLDHSPTQPSSTPQQPEIELQGRNVVNLSNLGPNSTPSGLSTDTGTAMINEHVARKTPSTAHSSLQSFIGARMPQLCDDASSGHDPHRTPPTSGLKRSCSTSAFAGRSESAAPSLGGSDAADMPPELVRSRTTSHVSTPGATWPRERGSIGGSPAVKSFLSQHAAELTTNTDQLRSLQSLLAQHAPELTTDEHQPPLQSLCVPFASSEQSSNHGTQSSKHTIQSSKPTIQSSKHNTQSNKHNTKLPPRPSTPTRDNSHRRQPKTRGGSGRKQTTAPLSHLSHRADHNDRVQKLKITKSRGRDGRNTVSRARSHDGKDGNEQQEGDATRFGSANRSGNVGLGNVGLGNVGPSNISAGRSNGFGPDTGIGIGIDKGTGTGTDTGSGSGNRPPTADIKAHAGTKTGSRNRPPTSDTKSHAGTNTGSSNPPPTFDVEPHAGTNAGSNNRPSTSDVKPQVGAGTDTGSSNLPPASDAKSHAGTKRGIGNRPRPSDIRPQAGAGTDTGSSNLPLASDAQPQAGTDTGSGNPPPASDAQPQAGTVDAFLASLVHHAGFVPMTPYSSRKAPTTIHSPHRLPSPISPIPNTKTSPPTYKAPVFPPSTSDLDTSSSILPSSIRNWRQNRAATQSYLAQLNAPRSDAGDVVDLARSNAGKRGAPTLPSTPTSEPRSKRSRRMI